MMTMWFFVRLSRPSLVPPCSWLLFSLSELWALLNFLIPEIFGSAEHFDEWFSLTDEKGQENVIKKLHTVLRPFMLRRVKRDVATALPPKKETKLYIGMTPMQQEWYIKVLQKDAHVLNSLDGPERVRLLNVLSKCDGRGDSHPTKFTNFRS
jgi:SWI/SNF-related matrix-associated actin-dependent regulator of chromatin subfamily A member 5